MKNKKKLIDFKTLWCLMFHEKYHKKYKDRCYLHSVTVIDCVKCKRTTIIGTGGKP